MWVCMLGGVDDRDIEHFAKLTRPLDVAADVQNNARGHGPLAMGFKMLGSTRDVKAATKLER